MKTSPPTIASKKLSVANPFEYEAQAASPSSDMIIDEDAQNKFHNSSAY